MVVLVPMTAEEFADYVAGAIPAYAQDKVDSGEWAAEASLALSKQGYDALLPRGLESPDNFLFTIREAADRDVVGMLWYAIQPRAGERIAYVYDFAIEPHCRRKGFGMQAFEALEIEAASRGLAGIALHVFGHNAAARALYAKLGFHPTNINLFKKASATRV